MLTPTTNALVLSLSLCGARALFLALDAWRPSRGGGAAVGAAGKHLRSTRRGKGRRTRRATGAKWLAYAGGANFALQAQQGPTLWDNANLHFIACCVFAFVCIY